MRYKNFAKGVATGMLVGAAATLFFDPMTEKQKCKIRKRAKGVFKSIASVVDTAIDIMR